MGQKIIALPERLYERLKLKKEPGETWPALIERLLNVWEPYAHPPISAFFGLLAEDDPEEWDRIEAQIYRDRLDENLEL